MIVFFDQKAQEDADKTGRYIPYEGTSLDKAGAYYDFRANPEQIGTVLEDFVAHSQRPAIQRFYDLIRWLNGPDSSFESTDCQMRTRLTNETRDLGKGASEQINGRLVIIYRDHARNTDPVQLTILENMIEEALRNVDSEWEMGAIGLVWFNAHFTSLGAKPSPGTIGHELCFRFWAWGNDEDETFVSLDRLVGNLASALRLVSKQSSARSR